MPQFDKHQQFWIFANTTDLLQKSIVFLQKTAYKYLNSNDFI